MKYRCEVLCFLVFWVFNADLNAADYSVVSKEEFEATWESNGVKKGEMVTIRPGFEQKTQRQPLSEDMILRTRQVELNPDMKARRLPDVNPIIAFEPEKALEKADKHYPLWVREPDAEKMNALILEEQRFPQEMSSKSLQPWHTIGNGIYNPYTNHLHKVGRTTSVKPMLSGDIFLGASGGGLWKLPNGQTDFISLSSSLVGSPSVGAFHVDGANTDRIVIGTGDYPRMGGTGIYWTTDGGTTWAASAINPIPSYVFRILADPDDPDTLLMAASSGLYRSTDFAQNWHRVTTCLMNPMFTDLAIDPGTDDHWYAVGPGQNIIESIDNGLTFHAVSGGVGLPIDVGIMSIAISPDDPDYIFILASKNTPRSALAGVFRSHDGGLNFENIRTVDKISWDQAYHTCSIEVDPSNANHLYIAMGGMEKTSNAKADTVIWTDLVSPGHADYSDIDFIPYASTWDLVFANDGGIYLYDDDTDTVNCNLNLGHGLHIEQSIHTFGNFAVSPLDDNTILHGLYDNGVVVIDSTQAIYPYDMTYFSGGDGGQVSFSPNTSGIWLWSAGAPYNRYFSLDFGQHEENIDCGLQCGWSDMVLHDPVPGNQISFTHNDQWVYYRPLGTCAVSGDWEEVNPNNPIPQLGGKPIKSVDKAQDATDNVFYVTNWADTTLFVMDEGDPLHGTLGDMSFSKRTPVAERAATDIACNVTAAKSDQLPNVVYYTTVESRPSQAFISDDRGVTWQDVTGNMNTNLSFVELLSNPLNALQLYLATNAGIYRSDDGGVHWLKFSEGMPVVTDITGIEINDGTSQRLHAASYGAGTWERTICSRYDPPYSATATPLCTGNLLTWQAVAGATSYRIYRTTSADCTTGLAELTTVSSALHNDTTAIPGTTYYYKIQGLKSCGDTNLSSCVSAARLAVPSKPDAPTFPTVECTAVTISWDSVPGATSYTLYRKVGSCGAGEILASDVTNTSYDDDGLLANNDYSYYAVAHNSCGESEEGDCATVSTVNTLETPTNFTSSDSCSSINLFWSAVSNATQYVIYRTQDPACPAATMPQVYVTSSTYFIDENVVAGATYYYRIQAENDCGTSPKTACCSGTRLSLPQTPTGLSATDLCSSVDLAWTPVSGEGITYSIYRTTNSDCLTGLTRIALLMATSYSDKSVEPGQIYHYRVSASNMCGPGSYSTCVSGSLLGTPEPPPTINASGSCSDITITWPSVPGAYGYNVYRSSFSDCQSEEFLGATTYLYYVDSIPEPGETFYYKVKTWSVCGLSTFSNCASGTRLNVPDPPEAPSFSDALCWTVTVSWPAVSGATLYDLYRMDGECGGAGSRVGRNLSTLSYNDSGLEMGHRYSYYVIAHNNCGYSIPGTCNSVTLPSPPAAPQGLAATGTCSSIELSWGVADGANDYLVFRTISSNCSTSLALRGTTTGTTFSDSSVSPGITYYYLVQSRNNCSESDYSTCFETTLTIAPDAPTGLAALGQCDGIFLSWDSMPRAQSYEILATSSSSCSSGLVVIGSSSGTSYLDTDATPTATRYYRVRAVNVCGTSTNSGCASAQRPYIPATPGAPSFPAVDCTAVSLTWSAVARATSYSILRSSEGNPASPIASGITETSWSDSSGLTPGSEYTYTIVADNACGSTPGSTASTTPGIPAAPTGVLGGTSCGTAFISWDSVSGATSYELYRSDVSDCSSGLVYINDTTETYLNDDTAPLLTTSSYHVRARNSCGTSVPSLCVASYVDTEPQGAPANFSAIGSCDSVSLNWDAVPGATSYTIIRSANCIDTDTTFTTSAISYNDTTAGPGTFYYYRVSSENYCGFGPESSCLLASRLANPTPMIAGPMTNLCPETSVMLSTEAAFSNYQWYRNGTQLEGETDYTLQVFEGGSYQVSYDNIQGCSALSAAHIIIMSYCPPPVIFFDNATFPEEVSGKGSGDEWVEAGEKWQISITVRNDGGSNAVDVIGSLAGEGLYVCNNPGSFGTIGVGGYASYTFQFIVNPAYWYSVYSCGSDVLFDLLVKSSNDGHFTFDDDIDIAMMTVGSPPPPESGQQQDIPLTAINQTSTTPFDISFTTDPAEATSAEISWMLLGSTDLMACVQLQLEAPDNALMTLKDFSEMDLGYADVLSFYQTHGTGIYSLLLTEATNCFTTDDLTDNVMLDTASMQVYGQVTGGNCETSDATCSGSVPEVSDDEIHWLSVTKNGDNVDLTFEDVATSHYQVYVSNAPVSTPFQTGDPGSGKSDCLLSGWIPQAGNLLTVTDYDLEYGISGTTDILYILVSADNGPETEGPLGYTSASTERTVDDACNAAP